MSTEKQENRPGLSRRDAFKLTGLAAGALALGTGVSDEGCTGPLSKLLPSQLNTYFESLRPFHPGEELDPNEMRITFLGTTCMPRLTQACNSVFVELGNGESFVFDCGQGVITKYYAMQIGLRKMDKIFLTHLHADHFNDLIYIYGFGPSDDRKTPLYVWGPSKSLVPDPVTKEVYEDGTVSFCKSLMDVMRWHNESQSFVSTSLESYTPPSWAPQDKKDAYDLVGFDLDWQSSGVAYDDNDVKISWFPAVHCRQGSISYKLEWNGMSMIFLGDGKPCNYVVEQANPGVDVLIHEIVVPAEVWAERGVGVSKDDPNYDVAVANAQMVQDSSHTPQRAYGYILSQIENAPRLAVATHFQAADDTIHAALKDIRVWYPHGDVIVATDLMVLKVTKDRIEKRRGVVSDFSWQPPIVFDRKPGIAKYHYDDGSGNPYAQLDMTAPLIDPALWEADPER